MAIRKQARLVYGEIEGRRSLNGGRVNGALRQDMSLSGKRTHLVLPKSALK